LNIDDEGVVVVDVVVDDDEVGDDPHCSVILN